MGLAGLRLLKSLRRRRGSRNSAIRSRDIEQGEHGDSKEAGEELGNGACVVHELQCDA